MAHMKELEAKIPGLKAMSDALKTLVNHYYSDHRADCLILNKSEVCT